MLYALQPVVPLLKGQLDGEEFSVSHIVIPLSGEEEGTGM
jgi:hypothetical protein